MTGTTETLSCSLVNDFSSGNYGLLQYIADKGTFSMVYRSTNGSIFGNSNMSIASAKNTTILKENCQAGYEGNTLYRLVNSTTVAPLSAPAGWTASSSPESMLFGVANNILYRYNSQNGTFAAVYTFPQNQAY